MSIYNGKEIPAAVTGQVPEEYRQFKFLVLLSVYTGDRFFTTNDGKLQINWYQILAGFDRVQDCQEYLGIPKKYQAKEE